MTAVCAALALAGMSVRYTRLVSFDRLSLTMHSSLRSRCDGLSNTAAVLLTLGSHEQPSGGAPGQSSDAVAHGSTSSPTSDPSSDPRDVRLCDSRNLMRRIPNSSATSAVPSWSSDTFPPLPPLYGPSRMTLCTEAKAGSYELQPCAPSKAVTLSSPCRHRYVSFLFASASGWHPCHHRRAGYFAIVASAFARRA